MVLAAARQSGSEAAYLTSGQPCQGLEGFCCWARHIPQVPALGLLLQEGGLPCCQLRRQGHRLLLLVLLLKEGSSVGPCCRCKQTYLSATIAFSNAP